MLTTNGATKLGMAPIRPQKDILLVKSPRGEPEGFVRAAVSAIRDEYGDADRIEEVRSLLRQRAGGIEGIAKLTAKLDAAPLDVDERLLLSTAGVYATLVRDAIETDKIKPTDTSALFDAVRRKVNQGWGANKGAPRKLFAEKMLRGALARRDVKIDEGTTNRVVRDLRCIELPLEAAGAEEAIFATVNAWRSKGHVKEAVDNYVARGEIDRGLLTERVRAAMVEHLVQLGVNFKTAEGALDFERLNAGDFDEYFALAYQQASEAGEGGTRDPIDAVRQKGAVSNWDFVIDDFDTTEEQGVVPENILAAGALDYVYQLGERLGLFRLADMVVLKWGSGVIDLDPGDTSSKLYRYWKLRAERTSPEERAMLYRRVFDRGDATLLDGMIANEAFPALWGNLMTAVTDYIARVEEKKTDEYAVSRQRIYQATKQLQYNLTEFCTGMAQMQVNEMYHHLQEARAILEDPQIVDYFGNGRRRTLWTVIERGSKEWFGETVNIAALRDAALQGNKVFQWIARFDPATTTDAEFLEFKDAAETWILAQAAEGPEPAATSPEEDPAAAPADPANDEFADWDK